MSNIDPPFDRRHSFDTSRSRRAAPKRRHGFTLLEVMISASLFMIIALGAAASLLFARRTAEDAIMQASATSIVYGLVEQMKTIPLSASPDTNQLPSPAGEANISQPHVYVRLNNTQTSPTALLVSSGSPPVGEPTLSDTYASVGATPNKPDAYDLSDTPGISSQKLQLELWLWIEPNYQPANMVPVTRVTLVYTYTFKTGHGDMLRRDTVRFVRAVRQIP